MSKVNYDYPLPQKNLHSRYDALFQALKKGLNAGISGLPQSSRSSFLKFILTYDQTFLKEFINPKDFEFIHIEAQDYKEENYISSIAYQIMGKVVTETRDPLLTLAIIKDGLNSSTYQKRIVFVVYEVDEFKVKNPETLKFIKDLLAINKHSIKKPGFQAVFISSPKNLDVNLADKIVNFNLLDKYEMDYTRARLEFFRDQKITNKVHMLACALSFGHYLLYKFLSDLTLPELQKIRLIRSHDSINNLLDVIWQGVSSTQDIYKLNPLFPPILLPPLSKSIRESDFAEIIKLTAQERILFDFLKNKNDIVGRDDIAKAIWRGEWTEKYSDWAIDKLVSKLKKKLIFSNYEILTIKNRGYQLMKHVK
jgi:DNA-binding winged helix-turn-helix (wHTH) protein